VRLTILLRENLLLRNNGEGQDPQRAVALVKKNKKKKILLNHTKSKKKKKNFINIKISTAITTIRHQNDTRKTTNDT
jgi:hypothetical protein